MPSRCALKVGPEAVPSRITLRWESPFVVANPCDSSPGGSETNNRKLSVMDLIFILPYERSIRLCEAGRAETCQVCERSQQGHNFASQPIAPISRANRKWSSDFVDGDDSWR